MSRISTIAILLSLFGCQKTELPDRQILVRITEDGRCLMDGKEVQCSTLGRDVKAANPNNSLTIMIDASEKADYSSLSKALVSIREAGITRTAFVNSN